MEDLRAGVGPTPTTGGPMHRVPAQVPALLAQNRARYDRLLAVTAAHASAGDPERVLRSAALTAAFGWAAPHGRLADPELEGMVTAAFGGGATRVDGGRSTGRVLHVLTEAYAVGGHSRLAWRWIGRDHRRSDVALTNQHGPVPEQLVRAVEASGGTVHDLRTGHPRCTDRALRLRALQDDVDLVVLHTHPWDTTALAAAALPGVRPPVVLENHAEHAFWVGVAAADVVSQFHRAALDVSADLRGVPRERSALLGLPVDPPGATVDRDDVRRQLQLAQDAVVGLVVAAPHKLAPLWGRGMAPLLDRALGMSPQLTVVLVGPPSQGPWAQLAERHRGRVRALGPVPDAEPFYAAADVYLDSYPTRSGTSVLEAAAHGLPVHALHDLAGSPGHAGLFQADSPGTTGLARCTTPEQYTTGLRRLVADRDRRLELGAQAREAVLSQHAGPAWAAGMEAVYRQARALASAPRGAQPPAAEDPRYSGMLLAYMHPDLPVSTASTALGTLGTVADTEVQADAYAVDATWVGTPFTVRVAPGWEAHPGWTTRLLRLGAEHPHLCASLPTVGGDDPQGTATSALLVELLAGLGLTPEDCGDVVVEDAVTTATGAAPAVPLALTGQALDDVETVLRSPGWRGAPALSGNRH